MHSVNDFKSWLDGQNCIRAMQEIESADDPEILAEYLVELAEHGSLKMLISALDRYFLLCEAEGFKDWPAWWYGLSTFLPIFWQRSLKSQTMLIYGQFLRLREHLPPVALHKMLCWYIDYADWEDAPEMFHVSPNRLPEVNFDHFKYIRDRWLRGPFNSEAEYHIWCMARPESQSCYCQRSQRRLVDVLGLLYRVRCLHSLGRDIRPQLVAIYKMLKRQWRHLHQSFNLAGDPEERDRLWSAIKTTEEHLRLVRQYQRA